MEIILTSNGPVMYKHQGTWTLIVPKFLGSRPFLLCEHYKEHTIYNHNNGVCKDCQPPQELVLALVAYNKSRPYFKLTKDMKRDWDILRKIK